MPVTVCSYCEPASLDTQTPIVELKSCPKCFKYFCSQHASHIDPQFCQNCCSDITVEDKTYIKTEEEYDEQNDILKRETKKCRLISFQGASFNFYTEAIHKMDDASLKAYIEYHRAMVGALEHEIVSRKIEQSKLQLKVSGSYVVVKRTSEKKSKTTATPKQLDPAQIIAQLKAQGVTEAMIQAMFGASAKAVNEVKPEEGINDGSTNAGTTGTNSEV